MSSRAEPSSGRRKKSTKKSSKVVKNDQRKDFASSFGLDKSILKLKYKNEDYGYIFDLDRPDIIIEIIGLFKSDLKQEDIYSFLEEVETPTDILWKQPLLSKAKESLEREIYILRSANILVKGGGKCKHCSSENVGFVEIQTRSGDESLRQFYRCSDCQKTWQQ